MKSSSSKGRKSPIPQQQQPDYKDYKEWRIILKNDSAQQLVLYNESDRSLQVHGTAEIDIQKPHCCSECGRPWPVVSSPNDADTENDTKTTSNAPLQSPQNQQQFIDRNYFRLLDISSRQQQQQQAPQVAFHQSPLLQYVVQPEKKKGGSKLASHQTTLTEEEPDHDPNPLASPKNLSDSSINQGYYKRFFKEGTKLGRGAGGSVFKCQHMLDGIELGAYAVKKVPVGDDHSWLNRMLREVHILENLRHPHIIEYKHAWLEYHQLTPFGPAIPCLFILMQLAEGGNLEEFVLNNNKNNDPNFNISLYCEWFEQICLGLAHLHQCGILHRDLKPSNILIKMGKQEGRAQLLITDFGECTTSDHLSSIVSPADHNRTGATGTIEFVAPELLKIDRKSGQYLYQQSKSTDIWSLGLIFYFMLTGKLPYPDIDDLDLLKTSMTSLKQVVLPKEANKLPKGFKKALGAMLQVDPELRPSIEQVLILIKDSVGPNSIPVPVPVTKRLIFPPDSSSTAAPQPSNPPTPLDENARISLALFMICISVIPTYPTIPSFRRIVLALAFTFSALKTTKQRSAIGLLTAYIFLIVAFYFNKID